MALMTTSGSMPFSFASASIVCCRGFAIIPLSELDFQVRPCNGVERHAVPLAVVFVYEDVGAFDSTDPSPKKRLAVHRGPHHELGAPPREPAVVVRVPQRAVEPG